MAKSSRTRPSRGTVPRANVTTRSASAGARVASTKSPRNRRADGLATRARVLSAAAEAFARDGYEGASLRGIAEAAGVDIATLKYHVGDKAALFAEVYRDGYQHFQQSLGPLLLRVPLARNVDELETEVRALLERGYDYLDEHEVFVRLWLFRLLGAPEEVVEVEETMRSNLMSLLEAAVGILRERGLVREVDVRVLVLLVLTGLPTLMLGARSRPSLLGDSPLPPRERFVAFFVEMLRRELLPASPSR